jgi:membrane protease YdiL (CAAX protease family)
LRQKDPPPILCNGGVTKVFPFWFPALWIGLSLWLLPQAPVATLLGYHGLCLLAISREPRPNLGRLPPLAWAVLGAGLLALPLLYRWPTVLPLAGAQTFLAAWPGGFPSYVLYTLTVNSICEEGYWRHALPRQQPGWGPWQHGAAFGLHHFIANGLVFGWAAAPLAFLYTAVGGRAAIWATRRCGGLLVPILGHSLINALSFAWMAQALRP